MSDPDTLIGHSIDHYQITRHLARGGMAELYLALDLSLKREVVLKIMLPQLTHDENFVTRFQREARATARLNHPHIIQVYSTDFTPDGRPYLAMQYIRGGSLQERLDQLANQQQLMTAQVSLTIGRQLADALHTAHQAGIVHRDLKPSNILLHPSGAPVLTDLGIAAIASDTHLTRTGDVLGTPYYMSPEQARGERPDGRADIYIINSDGTGLHQLTFDDLYTGHMSWSINDEIAFNAGPEGETWDIYVISAGGQNLRQLTSNDSDDWSPEWSPDGRFILYLSMLPGNDPAIFLMNADGSNQHQLYNTSNYEWGADWSADGRQIIFTSEEAGISSIYIINSDGSSLQLIAGHASYPSWAR